MTVARFQSYAALGAAYLLLFVSSPEATYAQQQGYSAKGTNRTSETDRAAGNMLDAIFENKPMASSGSNYPSRRMTQPRPTNRSTLQAKLVRNSNKSEGAPPYALVDRYGGILRYVEPVDRVELKPYLGKVVGVKHDTGDILLASQLLLPSLSSTKSTNGVQLAAFQEPIPAGSEAGEALLEPTPADGSDSSTAIEETYSYDGSFDGDPMYLGADGIQFGDCPHCGQFGCDMQGGLGAGVWQPSRVYLRADYLHWWFDGMNTPPLVTTSDPQDGGVLPNPGQDDNQSTRILYGGSPILKDSRNGFRIQLGTWIDDAATQAIEADYLFLNRVQETYTAGGQDGNPTISRPFFDFFPVGGGVPQENAEEVSSDNLDGSVTVMSSSEFQGAGIGLRHNLCRCGAPDCVTCGDSVGCGSFLDCGSGPIGCGCGVGCRDRRYVDFLMGFRWYQLREDLMVMEDLIVDIPPEGDTSANGTKILVMDKFSTSNDFTGGDLGFNWGIERNRWSMDLLTKIAIGNNRQRVSINGSTQTIPPDTDPAPDPAVGGLLALAGNIGDYERNRFSMIPEINLNVGYKLTQALKVRAGYTLMYWTNVVRPGDQIDRQINSTLLPGVPPVDVEPIPLKPLFSFNETNLLIQGINIGGEYSW